MFNFVWILGSGSNYNNEEIRYSIRSVVKYHPDARIVIVGEKPHFYTGEHYYVADSSNNAYINVINKMEFACELFDQWICMNDDFYLLEPFKPAHFFTETIKSHAQRLGSGDWADLIKRTAKAIPSAKRWTIHAPLPIITKDFRMILDMFPDRYENPISPKSVYCHFERKFDKVEMKDVKYRGTLKSVPKSPFFSIANNFGRNKELFQELYPNKTTYEL